MTAAVEHSPEKAGVGGSIPSLATMFSTTCRPPDSRFHSVSFQFQKGPSGIALRMDLRVWRVLFTCTAPRKDPAI